MKKAIIYTRVSTSRQDNARQLTELKKVAELSNYKTIEVIEEKVSGAKNNNERIGLTRVLELASEKKFEVLFVSELSRIGRKPIEILGFVESMNKLGINIFIKDINLYTLDEKGKPNPVSDMMVYMLSLVAKLERQFLRERISSGLAEARRRGVILGRKKGESLSDEALLDKHQVLVRLFKQDQSLRNAATIAKVSLGTSHKVYKAYSRSLSQIN